VGTAGPATASLADLEGTGTLSLVAAGAVSELRRLDAVVDTFATLEMTALAIQSLPGSSPAGESYWAQYMGGLERTGRVEPQHAVPVAGSPLDGSTFMVYPNPVGGTQVHARVMLNASATVTVYVYNLEGQEAFSRSYSVNPGGAVSTPFDEIVDVSALKSGVYFMRLYVETPEGAESLVKPFAIRR
jgi:hypothetical protein